MLPQGTSLINTDQFTNMIDSINTCKECAQLQELVDEAYASLNAMIDGAKEELMKLMPVISLTSGPSVNLGAIVTWINTFIDTVLTPLIKPTITYAAQLTATLAAIEEVAAAIEAAAARLTSCTITIPS